MEQQNQSPTPQDEIRLSDYLRILLQYRYLIVLVFVIVVSITIVYTGRQPRIYSASNRILLESKSSTSDMMFFAPAGTGKTGINNQIELIKSTPTMTAAWEIMK